MSAVNDYSYFGIRIYFDLSSECRAGGIHNYSNTSTIYGGETEITRPLQCKKKKKIRVYFTFSLTFALWRTYLAL